MINEIEAANEVHLSRQQVADREGVSVMTIKRREGKVCFGRSVLTNGASVTGCRMFSPTRLH